jgi:ElaB/YqjD/DUF883 family membrane-anchored ribosome-binding protein
MSPSGKTTPPVAYAFDHDFDRNRPGGDLFCGHPQPRQELPMTDPYAAQGLADDIDTDLNAPSQRLSRQADSILDEADARLNSLRARVRADLHEGRVWAEQRTDQARAAIQEEPLRATAYAVGIGVLIGLLLRR